MTNAYSSAIERIANVMDTVQSTSKMAMCTRGGGTMASRTVSVRTVGVIARWMLGGTVRITGLGREYVRARQEEMDLAEAERICDGLGLRIP